MTNLEVLEWTDASYMPPEFVQTGRPPEEYMQKPTDFDYFMSPAALLEISNHRYRQRVFLAQCMRKHRVKGNSWVIHIDTGTVLVV